MAVNGGRCARGVGARGNDGTRKRGRSCTRKHRGGRNRTRLTRERAGNERPDGPENGRYDGEADVPRGSRGMGVGMERSLLKRSVAVLLGLVVPGLGQVYNRQYRRAFIFNLLWWGAMWMAGLTVGLVAAPLSLALAWVWLPCVYIWMSVDAFRAARLPARDSAGARNVWPRIRPYGAFVSLLLIGILLSEGTDRYYPWIVTTVRGRAMESTLADGDRVVIYRYAYDNDMPVPGDIVTFERPGDRDGLLLQRCIAIEGQTVTIDDGVVYVDGIRFNEPSGVQFMHQDFGPTVVPRGHFFVMGDNRLSALDSRLFGTVPGGHLRGKVVRILTRADGSWRELDSPGLELVDGP